MYTVIVIENQSKIYPENLAPVIVPVILKIENQNLHCDLLYFRYTPQDIYNMDETALYYQLLPGRTYARPGERVHGIKQSKARVSLAFWSNMDGSDKRKPILIGISKIPKVLRQRSLDNKLKAKLRHLPIRWMSSARGWMTKALMEELVEDFNNEMVRKNRKVVLIMDNASSHAFARESFSNVEIAYTPPNTTATLQPMDQGIIR